MDIRSSIKAVIAFKDLKHAELSNSVGCSRSQLSRYLNGHSELRSDNFIRLFECLDIDFKKVLNLRMRTANKDDLKNRKLARQLAMALGLMTETEKKTISKTMTRILKSKAKNKSVEIVLKSLSELIE